MTRSIYESWLKKIYKKFHHEKRKVANFVDNCSTHANVLFQTLKAVKIDHQPANTTSKLQPMDQGIIKNLKVNYRRRIVNRVLNFMNEDKKDRDINLREAIGPAIYSVV